MTQQYRRSEFIDRSSLARSNSVQSAILDGHLPKLPPRLKITFVRRATANSTEQQQPLNLQNLIRRSSLLTTTCKLCELNRTKEELDCLSDCGHRFCHECLRNYVMYKLNVMEEVTCPEEGCPRKIDMNSQSYVNLPEEYKRKYYRLHVWMQTIDNPNLKLCPAEQCNGVINTALSYSCQQCKVEYCPECMLKQHQGACDANFQHNFKDWKRCPQCKMFIEKTEGCNHMTCNCHHEFCYVCLDNWSQDHYECGQRLVDPIVAGQFLREMSPCKRKSLAVLMVVIFPIAFVLGVAGIVIAMAVGASVGALCGPFMLASNSNNASNLIGTCCPLVMVLCAIVGFFGALYYGIVTLVEVTKRYCHTIGDFWSFQNLQDGDHIDLGVMELID